MKRFYSISAFLLGLIFLIGGINGVMLLLGVEPFFPVNSSSPLAVVLTETPYLFYAQKSVEFAAGSLLVLGVFRWPALLALAPLVVGIFLFHLFEDRERLGVGLGVLLLYVFAVLGYAEAFRALFKHN